MTSATAPEGDRDRPSHLGPEEIPVAQTQPDQVDLGGLGRWFVKASRWPCNACMMFSGPPA